MKNTQGITLPEYNGYSSKFTWLVSLWLDNDYGLYSLLREWAKEVKSKQQLADQVKDFVEEQNPLAAEASMYSDMMSYTIALVDFNEVVEGYWEERDTSDDE